MTIQMGRFLVIVGIILVGVGLLFMSGVKWPFYGPGRLPGDIHYRGKNFQFYFPVVTCLVLSLLITLLCWVISLFTRK